MQVAGDQVTLPIDTGDASYSVDVQYTENMNNQDDSNQDDSNQDDSNQDDSNQDDSNQDDSNQDDSNQDDSSQDDSSQDGKSDSGNVRKRIGTLTKKWRTAEREVAQLKKENKQLRKPSGNMLAEPLTEHYDDANDYMAAMVDWKIQQSQITQSASSIADVETQIADKSTAILKEKQVYLDQAFTLAETKYKDFNTVFNDSVPVSNSMVDSLLCLDNIGDVAYYLG